MNLSNIKVGDIVANYPKMCKLLEVEHKKRGPRERQIEDWKRFFFYEKQGHKFIITEIHQNEKPKIDGRTKGNNSVYVKYTSALLLTYLLESYHEQELTVIEIYNREVKTIIGLCNEKFIDDSELLFKRLYEDKSITKHDKDNFYLRANTKMNEIIKSTFKHMTKTYKFIEVSQVYSLSISINSEKIQRIATSEEEEIIKNITEAVLIEFESKNMSSIFLKHRTKEFYDRVNELLLEQHGWSNLYRANQITFKGDISALKGEYTLTEEENIKYIHVVNKLTHDFLDRQAAKEIAKDNTIVEANSNDNKNTKIRRGFTPPKRLNVIPDYARHSNYLRNQKYLSNLLIAYDE
ncbi:MAG: hypothetical protein ACXVZU_03385 [Methanobacteriaceae archaeon]